MQRRFIAIVLMTVYVLIAMSPFAPVALHSKYVAHAITGECVGEGNSGGCSPESRGKTCCCAQKRQMLLYGSSAGTKSCCLPKAIASIPFSSAPEKRHCCAGSTNAGHAYDDHDASEHNTDNRKVTVLKCGCPCGKGKLLAFNGFGTNEIIPFIANERIAPHHTATLFFDLSKRQVSRNGEPPDPPPKLV